MTVERIHPKAPVMLIFIAIFKCLPSCINLSNIELDKYFWSHIASIHINIPGSDREPD